MSLLTVKRNIKSKPVLLGAHFSIAGGLENALKDAMAYGCSTCQIFTKNSQTWRERVLSEKEIEVFTDVRNGSDVKIIASHTSYLINLATPDTEKRKKSCAALQKELERSDVLGLQYVILHPGSHMGTGEKEGLCRIIDSLKEVLSRAPTTRPVILIETTAGQGSHLGYRFEQLAEILNGVGDANHFGVCLDTAHIFSAGYDIRTKTTYRRTLDRFDSLIGLKHLKFIHLNDSQKMLNSHVDRHAHIGEGLIGAAAFQCIMKDVKLQHIPKVIETPKERGDIDWDAINLKRLRAMIA